MDLERIRGVVGEEAWLAAGEATAFAVGGVIPERVVAPGTRQEAAALIDAVREQGGALLPFGGGTQMGLGFPPRRFDLALSTRRLNRVVDYQPDDMTVTVEPGVTMAALAERLAARGQFLPLNPPLPEQATVGGTIAAAVSGPWRAMYGTPRDWVIGCRVVGADGQEVRGGGQVVKNVAGYDLPKLYTGSFGTLGLLTEVTFKVMPAPPALGVCRVTAPGAGEAEGLIAAALGSDLQPVSLESVYSSDQSAWEITFEFRHFPEAVEWQVAHLEQLAAGQGLAFSRIPAESAAGLLRAHADRSACHAFLARMSAVGSSAAGLADRTVEIAGRHGLPRLVWSSAATGQVFFQSAAATPELAQDVRAAATEAGATCLFPRLPAGLVGAVDPWGPVGPELRLMQGLKSTLDPTDLFSPGRFVGAV